MPAQRPDSSPAPRLPAMTFNAHPCPAFSSAARVQSFLLSPPAPPLFLAPLLSNLAPAATHTQPDSLEMALLSTLLPGLRDSWQVLYSAGATAPGPKHDSQVSSLGADQGDGQAAVEGSSSSAADAAGEASGFTCDAPGNSYKSTRQVTALTCICDPASSFSS